MYLSKSYIASLLLLFISIGSAQDLALNDQTTPSYENAYGLAYEGNHKSAKDILIKVIAEKPDDSKARVLLGNTYSWDGEYDLARIEFNKVTSSDKYDKAAWSGAIKNELYAKNEQIALGLANKVRAHLD